MLRRVGTILWILVLLFGAAWVYLKSRPESTAILVDASGVVGATPDGRAFAEVPWKRLPHMRRFQMTAADRQPFGTDELKGNPYVVSFFFANCPTICRDLNRQVSRLANEFKGSELEFVSISVDPDNDSPDRLKEYSAEFQANPDQWHFLTGPMHRVNAIGRQQFNVIVDGVHHTGDLFLVDRWGRWRDRFTWDDPREMKRFSEIAREVLAEDKPPIDATLRTRNVLASLDHRQFNSPWLFDFQLIDDEGNPFWSRDLTGQVQVVSFFFTRCPTVCPRQNRFLAGIQADLTGRNVAIVSITTDPQNDDPATLRQYARGLGAGDDWHFLTGDLDYIRKVGSEFLGIASEGEHHSTMLVVIDRWGQPRGRIDWQAEGARKVLLELIDRLNTGFAPSGDDRIETNVPEELP